MLPSFPSSAHQHLSSEVPAERNLSLTDLPAQIYAGLSPSSQSLLGITTMIYSNWHWIFKVFLLYVLISRVCIWFGVYERRRPVSTESHPQYPVSLLTPH